LRNCALFWKVATYRIKCTVTVIRHALSGEERQSVGFADTEIADEAGADRPGAERKTLAFSLNAEVFPIFHFPPLWRVTKIC
jgi:hypothetical protein